MFASVNGRIHVHSEFATPVFSGLLFQIAVVVLSNAVTFVHP
ncbi:hypothetical protein FHX15_002407 [Rhizobium sp. BK650]|nr:hypothetical protein [Rhizobium sp. BK650]